MELGNCNLCKERYFARAPVPSIGPKDAEVALIGRNPGRVEDVQGKPFVGRAGRKLNAGLLSVGLKRTDFRILNIVKCLTDNNDIPSSECRRKCSKQWLFPELEEMENLKLIVTFGNEALWIFENDTRVGQIHGTAFMVPRPWNRERKIYLFVAYHPSAALRSPDYDKRFFVDMQKLKEILVLL